MNTIYFLVCVILFSCNNQQQNSKKGNSNKLITGTVENLNDNNSIGKMNSNIDSLVITCLMFGTDSDKSFVVKWSNTKSEWMNFHNEEERSSLSQEKTRSLLSFINSFYLKKQSIILSKNEEPAPVSDYPIIEVVGFLKGKKIFEEKTTLYSNIEFNPKFLEFYEFLDSLVKQK